MTTSAPRRVRTSSAVVPADGRRQNLSLVLQTLRRLGPTSRAQLAREVGVTKVTMSDLVAELVAAGQVRDTGVSEHSGPGKPATLVELAHEHLLTLAVDLSLPARLQAAVVDIAGTMVVHEERAVTTDVSQGGRVDPHVVVELVEATLAHAAHPVLGIGIGTPGVVDRNGVVRTAPNLGWTDVPLRDLVAGATGLPVLVTNDSDAAAQAELSASPDSEDMILVHIGRGVGCGIVTGGHRIVGAHHAAGEIGHVTVGTDVGEPCNCGKRGCLETWLSLPLLRAAAGGGTLAEAAEVGGERLGVAIAPVVAALDLSEVVLSGPAELVAPLVAVVERTLGERLLSPAGFPLSVRLAGSPQEIVLRGAAALVLWDRLGVV